jgi:hypothetical protein
LKSREANAINRKDSTMKAEVYDTVNFPAYAIIPFEYGILLENESDNQNRVVWERELHIDIIQDGCRLVSIEFGEDEYFSNSPCFGRPCNCVDATIFVEKL